MEATQLKSAVYLVVAKMVERELAALPNVLASPTYVALLVDLVFNQLVTLGEDLELFANHAGRVTVKPDDLYMATRRNESLTAAIRAAADALDKSR